MYISLAVHIDHQMWFIPKVIKSFNLPMNCAELETLTWPNSLADPTTWLPFVCSGYFAWSTCEGLSILLANEITPCCESLSGAIQGRSLELQLYVLYRKKTPDNSIRGILFHLLVSMKTLSGLLDLNLLPQSANPWCGQCRPH